MKKIINFTIILSLILYALFSLQPLVFAFLGVGGFALSAILNLSMIALLVPALSLLSLILLYFVWEKYSHHLIYIILFLYALLSGTIYSLVVLPTGHLTPGSFAVAGILEQIVLPVIGLVISIIAFIKMRKEVTFEAMSSGITQQNIASPQVNSNQSSGKKTARIVYLILLIIAVLVLVTKIIHPIVQDSNRSSNIQDIGKDQFYNLVSQMPGCESSKREDNYIACHSADQDTIVSTKNSKYIQTWEGNDYTGHTCAFKINGSNRELLPLPGNCRTANARLEASDTLDYLIIDEPWRPAYQYIVYDDGKISRYYNN
jgi:hypothetical protein